MKMKKVKGNITLERGGLFGYLLEPASKQMLIESGETTVKFFNRMPRKMKKVLAKHRSARVNDRSFNLEPSGRLYGFNCSGEIVRKY